MSKKTSIPKARYSLKNYMGIPLKKGQRLLLERMRERGEMPARMREELEQIYSGKAENPAFDDAYSAFVNEKGEVEEVHYNPNHPRNIMESYFRKRLGEVFGMIYCWYVFCYHNGGEKNLNPKERKEAEEDCKLTLKIQRKRLDREEKLSRGELTWEQLIEDMKKDKLSSEGLKDSKILT